VWTLICGSSRRTLTDLDRLKRVVGQASAAAWARRGTYS
jgi:hypothetical protein